MISFAPYPSASKSWRHAAIPAFLLILAPVAAADLPKALTAQGAVTLFIEAQDVAAFTPEQLAERARGLGDEPEVIAADASLNQWKLCVQDALVHWAPLAQGPGTLVDGAFGRCADLERDYRGHLVRMSPGGRAAVDFQLARTMTKALEESWRPRLTALVLDQALVRQASAPAPAPQPARETSGRAKEDRPPRP